jgi:hypothetical protein
MHLRRWHVGPALLLGLAVGWALPRPAPALAPSAALRGPVCGAAPARVFGAAPSCDTARRDACWSELEERTAPRPTTLVGFEGVPEAEQPEAWVPQVERAVMDCDPDAVIEVTDCSTFPCVAAVRPGKDWVAAGCEWEISEGMGLVPVPLEVGCQDGSTEPLFFVTMLAEDTARAALGIPPGAAPGGLISGLIGQRVDTVLEMWPCDGS